MECNNVVTRCGMVAWGEGGVAAAPIFVFEMQLMHEKQSEKIEIFLNATNKRTGGGGRWMGK